MLFGLRLMFNRHIFCICLSSSWNHPFSALLVLAGMSNPWRWPQTLSLILILQAFSLSPGLKESSCLLSKLISVLFIRFAIRAEQLKHLWLRLITD